MRKNFRYLLFLPMLLLGACRPSSPAGKPGQDVSAFFDLEQYFEKEIQRLEKDPPGIRKVVYLDQKEEEQRLDSLDFRTELDVFIQSGINRIAWRDKYAVDSLFENHQLTAVRYDALDEKLRTRTLRIEFGQNQVARISIQNRTNSLTSQHEQDLIYDPDKGYSIQSEQSIVLLGKKSVRVRVDFLD